MDTPAKPHYLGHRKRLKESFEKSGLNSFADYEALEFALTFAVPRKDTKPLAKELIKSFGGLKEVLDAEKDELLKIKGVSNHTAAYISFLRQFASLYALLDVKGLQKLNSSQGAVGYLTALLSGEKTEKLYALLLNSGNKVIESLEIERGTVNKSAVFPRKIAEAVLKHKASAVIIAHNHPGESLKPSKYDFEATSAVKAALAALDVVLLDHIIISGNKHFSFRENNLI